MLYDRCPNVTDFHLIWRGVANGKQQVTSQITFDQPMLSKRFGSWIEGGDSDQIGDASYDPSAKIMAYVYRVEFAKTLHFTLNPEAGAPTANPATQS